MLNSFDTFESDRGGSPVGLTLFRLKKSSSSGGGGGGGGGGGDREKDTEI